MSVVCWAIIRSLHGQSLEPLAISTFYVLFWALCGSIYNYMQSRLWCIVCRLLHAHACIDFKWVSVVCWVCGATILPVVPCLLELKCLKYNWFWIMVLDPSLIIKSWATLLFLTATILFLIIPLLIKICDLILIFISSW